jgi:soluble lytic murein transglycosylase-like protein
MYSIFLILSLAFGGEKYDVVDTFIKVQYLKPRYPPKYAAKVAKWLTNAANQTGTNINTIIAIAYIESGFRYWARGPANDTGLMQVMPFWKRQPLCYKMNLWDGEENALCGARILRHYINAWGGNQKFGIASYNQGVAQTWRRYKQRKKPVSRYADLIWYFKTRLDKFESQLKELRKR